MALFDRNPILHHHQCQNDLFAAVFWCALRHKDRCQRAARQAQAAPTKGWGILSPPTFASVLSIGVLDGSVVDQ